MNVVFKVEVDVLVCWEWIEELEWLLLLSICLSLRVELLLKTDSGHPKDTGVTLFTLATPGNPLRYNTHPSRSTPPVSALANSKGPGA